jgi:probable HAF family extracellular repeat protein
MGVGLGTATPQAPTSKEECKHGGYENFGPPAGPFKNQGQCVSYVEHHSHGTFPPVLTRLSTDTLTNSTSQHATEVEPDTFAFGSTIVSAFQVGRIITGAAGDVGFATSSDAGTTWTSGLLPGITIFQGGTIFNAAGDPVVAYDAAHAQWIIACLGVQEDASGNPTVEQVLVSRSEDGLSWESPIAVNPVGVYDKDWIVCDNTPSSPFYGHCYVQWRDKGLMTTSTSTDGGLTWQAPLHTADMVNGFGGQPLVQPNGTVISPMVKLLVTDMLSFTSTDGGASWTASTEISPITDHTVAGNLRSGQVPSAEIDALGTVYVVWADCRFRTNCSSNDLVMSTSSDGVAWTSPARIPIDPVSSTADHFIPGLAVDRSTSGSTAHLTLTYYYYPVSDCGTICDLYVGFVSSQDGGQTWSAPVPLAGPMKTDWLASTGGNVAPGYFVGDYISGSYVNGNPFAVFAVAAPNSGTVFDEAMYTTAQPMMPPAGALYFSSRGEMPVPDAKSDHAPSDPYLERAQLPSVATPIRSFSFTTINVPGANATRTLGLNDHGQIVGDFVDAGGVRHGYILSNGTFRTFDPPGSIQTRGLAISNRGDIGGRYQDSAGVNHGYVLSHGSFTTFDFPGATATFLQGMNDHGQIVGEYVDSASLGHGFLLENGNFTTIDFSGAVATVATGINDSGHIVGYYDDSTGPEHGFLLENGNFTTVDVPGAFSLTDLIGTSNNGLIVGFYDDSNGASHGFELRDGNFTTIDVPGSLSTIATKVNSAGQVVGLYNDAIGQHGFLATPSRKRKP